MMTGDAESSGLADVAAAPRGPTGPSDARSIRYRRQIIDTVQTADTWEGLTVQTRRGGA
jgi:hypothetical protein